MSCSGGRTKYMKPYAVIGTLGFAALIGSIAGRESLSFDVIQVSVLMLFFAFVFGVGTGAVLMIFRLIPPKDISVECQEVKQKNKPSLKNLRKVQTLIKPVQDANAIINNAAQQIIGVTVCLGDIVQQMRANTQQEEDGLHQIAKASRYQLWQVFSQSAQKSECLSASLSEVAEKITVTIDLFLAAHKLIDDTMVHFYDEMEQGAGGLEEVDQSVSP